MRPIFAALVLAASVAASVPASAEWRSDCLSLPVSRPVVASANFGDKTDFMLKHDGLDLAVPVGTRVRAMAGGRVMTAELAKNGTSIVVVRTGAGRYYQFLHMTKVFVHEGDKVRRGQTVGLSGGAPGSIGSGPATTGPHLHVGVAGTDGKLVDPLTFLCHIGR